MGLLVILDPSRLSDLEARVEFLLENLPCNEGQPPDILAKIALRAEKRPKVPVFSPRSGVSAACLKGRFIFRGFFMLQIPASFQVRQAASAINQAH